MSFRGLTTQTSRSKDSSLNKVPQVMELLPAREERRGNAKCRYNTSFSWSGSSSFWYSDPGLILHTRWWLNSWPINRLHTDGPSSATSGSQESPQFYAWSYRRWWTYCYIHYTIPFARRSLTRKSERRALKRLLPTFSNLPTIQLLHMPGGSPWRILIYCLQCWEVAGLFTTNLKTGLTSSILPFTGTTSLERWASTLLSF
jgi:hypothetical protein